MPHTKGFLMKLKYILFLFILVILTGISSFPALASNSDDEVVITKNKVCEGEKPPKFKCCIHGKMRYFDKLKKYPEGGEGSFCCKEGHECLFACDKAPKPEVKAVSSADFDWFLQRGKRDGIENCLKAYEGKYYDTPIVLESSSVQQTTNDFLAYFHTRHAGDK